MNRDVGCPTCGSKKVIDLIVEVNCAWNKKCNNCKKSWINAA